MNNYRWYRWFGNKHHTSHDFLGNCSGRQLKTEQNRTEQNRNNRNNRTETTGNKHKQNTVCQNKNKNKNTNTNKTKNRNRDLEGTKTNYKCFIFFEEKRATEPR